MQIDLHDRFLTLRVSAAHIAACIAIVLGVWCLGSSRREEPEIVRTTGLQLVNKQGRVVAELRSDDEGPALTLLDAAGKPRVTVAFNEKRGGTVSITNSQGHQSLALAASDTTASMTIQAVKDGAMIMGRAAEEAGAIVVSGNNRAAGVATIAGTREGGRVGVLDSKGRDVAFIAAQEGQGTVAVASPDSERTIQMRGDVGSLLMYDQAGTPRLSLLCDEVDGPSLNLFDKQRKLRGIMTESRGDGRIMLLGDLKNRGVFEVIGGDRGAAMRFSSGGERPVDRITLSARSGAGRISILDSEGDSLFEAPNPGRERVEEPAVPPAPR